MAWSKVFDCMICVGGVGEVGRVVDDHRARCRDRRRAPACRTCRRCRTFTWLPVTTTRSTSLHQPRGRLARDRIGQDLHEVGGQADLLQLGPHAVDGGLAGRPAPSAAGAMMMALPPFSAIMALLTGVADGLVEGVMAPTTPTGLAYCTMPFSGISSMMPGRLHPRAGRAACRTSCAGS